MNANDQSKTLEQPCSQVREDLAAGLSSEQITLHLDQCAACSRVAAELQLLQELAVSLPRPNMPRLPHRARHRLQLIPALAATLVMGLGLGSLWVTTSDDPGHTSQPPLSAQAPPAAIPEQTFDLLATLEAAQKVWTSPRVQTSSWLAITTQDEVAGSSLQQEQQDIPRTEDIPRTAVGPNNNQQRGIASGSAIPPDEALVRTGQPGAVSTQDGDQADEGASSLALVNDPLGSLDLGQAAWSPPEILEYI